MKSGTKVVAIAVASVGLGVLGYALLSKGMAPPALDMKPIPLSMDLGPVAILPEPASSPYEALMEKAVRTAPGRDDAARQALLQKLRDLRARWQTESAVAAAPASPNAPGRL
ncbi:MAG: hypothetical protein HYY25_04355 [Candidatus Wallbacteria bacterium]|nr:hypothetical protein [Candidatus Wallbacteria bacterium]MBI4866121.1 hypothetical protein [Candidatus Wallbacteria bacterium]